MGAKGTSNEKINEDVRVTQARQILDATVEGHSTFGEAVGQVIELRHALGGVLSYVDENAPGGRLDGIAEQVTHLDQEMTKLVWLLAGAIADTGE